MTADTPNANTAAVNKIRFIESSSLFWIGHDLRANALRLSQGEPVPIFPDHAPFIERRVRHEIIMSNPVACGIFRRGSSQGQSLCRFCASRIAIQTRSAVA